jgi:hypothetical protein
MAIWQVKKEKLMVRLNYRVARRQKTGPDPVQNIAGGKFHGNFPPVKSIRKRERVKFGNG